MSLHGINKEKHIYLAIYKGDKKSLGTPR